MRVIREIMREMGSRVMGRRSVMNQSKIISSASLESLTESSARRGLSKCLDDRVTMRPVFDAPPKRYGI
jgi:hypothetical protein